MRRHLMVLASVAVMGSGMAMAQDFPAARASAKAASATQKEEPSKAPVAGAAIPRPGGAARLSAQQQQLLTDADQLVTLAQDLKAEVDKTNRYMLSLNTLRRAEEIEKRAKELQKQMERAQP